MINQGISPILMKTEAEYKVPVTIHDKPVGRIYLVKASKMKWVFQFEIGPHMACIVLVHRQAVLQIER